MKKNYALPSKTFLNWILLLAMFIQVQAQTQIGKYSVDGMVIASTSDALGNTYIGGTFSYIGLNNCGYGVKLDNTTAVQDTQFGKVNGDVYAVKAIPGGGWYIGGAFTSVNGITRNHLARFNADGTLNSFNPNINGNVAALEVDNLGNLYAAGSFTRVAGSTIRNHIAKWNSSGVLSSFNPNTDGDVAALVSDASGNLYAGGYFTLVGDSSRNFIAKWSAAGVLSSFNPNPDASVYCIAVDAANNIYAGGDFLNIGDSSRFFLAKWNAAGTLISFNPNFDGAVTALVLDGANNLYIAGLFTSAESGSVFRNYLAKYDAGGTIATFNPLVNNPVYAIAVDAADNFYAGGFFTTLNVTTIRNRIAKWNAAGALQSFAPDFNYNVLAIATNNSGEVYVGGQFFLLGPYFTRNAVAKFDALGDITSFDPNVEGTVRALAVDGANNLYVGGSFITVGGTFTRNRVAKYDASGALTSFNPNFNNNVFALAVDAFDNIYVGGSFNSVTGFVPRNRLAKFDASGVLDAIDPNIIGPVTTRVTSIAIDRAGNIFAGGKFLRVGSGIVRNNLASWDASGTLRSFDPNLNNIVQALALDTADNLYAGGLFTLVNILNVRNHLAAWNTAGTLMSFNPSFNNNVDAITFDENNNLYVGGEFTTVNSSTRNYFAKWNALGTISSFNPNFNNSVFTLTVDIMGKLHIGGLFNSPKFGYAVYLLNSGVGSMCSPININARIVSSNPYSVAGYANLNTHTDTLMDSNNSYSYNVAEPIGSCGSISIINRTKWSTFRAPNCATPQIIISTDDRSSTIFDSRISVYRRAVPSICSSGYSEIACNDNGILPTNSGATTNSTILLMPNNSSPIANEYIPGEDLYIQVAGNGSAHGNYGLIVDVNPLVPTVSTVGSGIAVLDWAAALSPTWGAVEGTFIQWRIAGSPSTVAGTYKYVSAPASTTTITGLIPGTIYEYWASYRCSSGGRWWSKKGTFTTSATCSGGVAPSIASITTSGRCNQPLIAFNATSLSYSSYRVIRKDTSSNVVLSSAPYYTSPTTQTYTSAPLTFGRTYQFYVVAFCGASRVDSSAISTFTTCMSLRTANPNATSEEQMKLTDLAANNGLLIYPNPAQNESQIIYNLDHSSTQLLITIIDAQGKEIMKAQIDNPELIGTYSIDLDNYSSGIYFVKVEADDFIKTSKLIIETK